MPLESFLSADPTKTTGAVQGGSTGISARYIDAVKDSFSIKKIIDKRG